VVMCATMPVAVTASPVNLWSGLSRGDALGVLRSTIATTTAMMAFAATCSGTLSWGSGYLGVGGPAISDVLGVPSAPCLVPATLGGHRNAEASPVVAA
jgi:hypothetical protein